MTDEELIQAARESDVPVCHRCGQPQSRNPHPDAGKPEKICEVGTVWECIPCLVLNRHNWSRRAWAAEKTSAAALAHLSLACEYYKTPEAIKRDGEYHPRFMEAMDAAAALSRAEGGLLERLRNFYLQRMDALHRLQHDLPEPYRTQVCNILANGKVEP